MLRVGAKRRREPGCVEEKMTTRSGLAPRHAGEEKPLYQRTGKGTVRAEGPGLIKMEGPMETKLKGRLRARRERETAGAALDKPPCGSKKTKTGGKVVRSRETGEVCGVKAELLTW